jgi:hypothetical protein
MRMLRPYLSLLGLSILAVAACQTTSRVQDQTAETLSVELIVRRAVPMQAEESSSPRDVHVWMMTSGGGAFVWPPKDVVIDMMVREGETFAVSLDVIGRALETAAKETAGIEPASYGVKYEPSDARISRLSTFSEGPNEPGTNYFTSFEEKKSKRMLILIYVDRPCTIRAPDRMVDGKPRIAIDAILPNAGLHWLIVDEESPGVSSIHTATPEGDLAYVLDGTRSR